MKAICSLYEQAPQLAQEGEASVSTDELTGVQALERKHPGLPLAPGKVERREFDCPSWHALLYPEPRCRHGQAAGPYAGPTRTEADFLAHLQAVVATDPEVKRWHIVCDHLNLHQSVVGALGRTVRASTKTWGSKARAAFWPRWPAEPPS